MAGDGQVGGWAEQVCQRWQYVIQAQWKEPGYIYIISSLICQEMRMVSAEPDPLRCIFIVTVTFSED